MNTLLIIQGLTADIIGTAYIFRFGLPQRISRSGFREYGIGEKDPEIINLAKCYDAMSTAGLIFLILGFIMQGIGTWIVR